MRCFKYLLKYLCIHCFLLLILFSIQTLGLAQTVTRQDLEELFGPFAGHKTNLDIKLHYNCAGSVLGNY